MRSSIRVGKVRWGIATLLGIGIIINYFDRVNLSVATRHLSKNFILRIRVFAFSYLPFCGLKLFFQFQ